ncbi:recQ-mediated genome instability protein 1 [Lobosporangium transversale]|nr:recQ-mediated genome instability protein 1 [Lobosporangium transversale]
MPRSTTANQDPAQFIFEMYLLADFRTLEPKPIFPSSVATPHKQWLFKSDDNSNPPSLSNGSTRERLHQTSGGVILQILEIQDIGISSLKMLEACEALGTAGDQPGGFLIEKALPRGMILLSVTDGVRKMKAILIEPIPGIAMEMKLGAKIRISDVEVRHGVLQLNRSNTLLLGGEVASMNRYPRRLVIMNQMKKRLGLPLDPLPTPSDDASTTQQEDQRISHLAETPTSVNRVNTNTTPNIWRSPQPLVTTQDTIPAGNPVQPLVTPKNIPNSWKTFRPAGDSASPLQPLPSALDTRDEENQYQCILKDQEPDWDLNQDMELDEIRLLDDDAFGWEAMSHISLEENVSEPGESESNNDIYPPPIASNSPPRKGLTSRRSLSLKSPRSLHQQQEDQKEKITRGKDSNSFGEHQRAKHARDKAVVDMNILQESSDFSKKFTPSSGNDSDTNGHIDKKRKWQDSPHLNAAFDLAEGTGFNSDVKNDEFREIKLPILEPRDIGLVNGIKHSTDHGSQQNKDRIEDDKQKLPAVEHDGLSQDNIINRKRSHSFLPSPGMEEDTPIKIKVERDENVLHGLKQEDSIAEETTLIKVKVEKTLASNGESYHAAIDLSSGDEAETISHASHTHLSGFLNYDMLSTDLQKKIKVEPLDRTTTSNATWMKEPGHEETMVEIKKEETLLEFDMNDDEDYGSLALAMSIIPEVELDQVKREVQEGREVKAKSRVHKLGKFSLTTLAVSIPIFLLPGTMTAADNVTALAETDMKLEAVLDQHVVESLLEYSIAEFRDLVRTNEPEAKRAVFRLRANLSEVEMVECKFKGMRSNVPVIREMSILSKKKR